MMGIEFDALPGLDMPVGVHGCLGGGDPGAISSPDIYLMIAIYTGGASDGADGDTGGNTGGGHGLI